MKTSMKIEQRELKRVTTALTQMDANLRKAVRRGVAKHCEIVLTKSQEEVPRITGALARSAYQEVEDQPQPHGVIGYRESYALPVHEIPRPASSNGKWKYLEDPFKAEEGNYIPRIVAEVAKSMGQTGTKRAKKAGP